MSREAKELAAERELKEMRSKVEDLHNVDWQVRLRAITSLIQVRKTEEFFLEAVPAIINATKDSEILVRQAAIPALGDLGVKVRPAIDRLIEILHLDSLEEVKGSVYSLGKIGPDAIIAVNKLIDLLKNPSDELHKAISWAISIIGPDTLEALKTNIVSENARIRRGVIVAIGNMGPVAISLLDDLILRLQDEDLLTKIEAARAIGNLRASPEVARAISSLDKLLDDNDPDVRWTSAEALRKVGSEDAMKAWARYQPIASVDAIAKQLSNQDKAVRENAAAELYDVLSKGKDNQLELIKFAFKDRHWKVPMLLCDALGKLEDEAVGLLDEISLLLEHEEASVRKSSSALIGKMGSSAVSVVPKVIKLLKDADKEVRTSAGVALELIGGKEAEKALKNFDWM
jgi:HEAT repeat protein